MSEPKVNLDLLNLPESPDLTLEQHIYLIRNIPDLSLEHRHGIVVDAGWVEKDCLIVDAMRREYIAKARWLDYYLLNEVGALKECENTDKAKYKPLVKIALAWYRLAQEVFAWQERHPKKLLFSPQQIKSPASWMTLCEIQFCSSRLINSLGSDL